LRPRLPSRETQAIAPPARETAGTAGDGLVRTAGLEPALPDGKQIFIPLRLSPPPRKGAFVVWTIPSPWPAPEGTRVRCRPSSLYTFRALSGGLGSGLARADSPELSPNLSGSAPGVSRPGTPIVKVCCVYRFRHARTGTFLPYRRAECEGENRPRPPLDRQRRVADNRNRQSHRKVVSWFIPCLSFRPC